MDHAEKISQVDKPQLSPTSPILVTFLVLLAFGLTGGLLANAVHRSELPPTGTLETSLQKVALKPSDPAPSTPLTVSLNDSAESNADPNNCVRHLATVVEEGEAAEATKLIDAYPAAAKSGCMHCHADIEMIREQGAEMLEQIMEMGEHVNDPAGCVVCHGGDATTTDKEKAHGSVTGKFFPDPGLSLIHI